MSSEPVEPMVGCSEACRKEGGSLGQGLRTRRGPGPQPLCKALSPKARRPIWGSTWSLWQGEARLKGRGNGKEETDPALSP